MKHALGADRAVADPRSGLLPALLGRRAAVPWPTGRTPGAPPSPRSQARRAWHQQPRGPQDHLAGAPSPPLTDLCHVFLPARSVKTVREPTLSGTMSW